MRAILDTSSLLNLVRYYLPIDRTGEIMALMEENFKAGEFIIIDKVYDEIFSLYDGLIIKEMPFLKDKKLHIKTNSIIPSALFFQLLNDEFIDKNIIVRRKLLPAAVELEKDNYINKADGRLLLYAESIRSENPIIITEETEKANDGKLIRKIPYNCTYLNLRYCNIPSLLKNHFTVSISGK